MNLKFKINSDNWGWRLHDDANWTPVLHLNLHWVSTYWVLFILTPFVCFKWLCRYCRICREEDSSTYFTNVDFYEKMFKEMYLFLHFTFIVWWFFSISMFVSEMFESFGQMFTLFWGLKLKPVLVLNIFEIQVLILGFTDWAPQVL